MDVINGASLLIMGGIPDPLSVNRIQAKSGPLKVGSATSGHSLTAVNDLLIEGKLEVDGTTFLDGDLTVGEVVLGSEEVSAWETFSVDPYDTFTTSGLDITSAINLAGAARARSTGGIGAVALGERYRITLTLTLNSGEAPQIYTGDVNGNTPYNLPLTTLAAGANTFDYIVTTARAAEYVHFYNGAAANWSVASFTCKKVTVADVRVTGALSIGADADGVLPLGVLGMSSMGVNPPSTSPANIVQLFAIDISSSSELRVRDEAGNVTTLSPHPTDYLDEKYGITADEPIPWAYHSVNGYLKKEVYVDMAALVRAVEALTGKKFMEVRDLPIERHEDWAANQESMRLQREDEIKAAIDAEAEVIPEPYVKKEPPQWMKVRGVQ